MKVTDAVAANITSDGLRHRLEAMPADEVYSMTEVGGMLGITRDMITRRVFLLPAKYHHRHKGKVFIGNPKAVAKLKGNHAS